MGAEKRPRLIRSDSPIWKLPQGLDPLQASFLDAIRLSVQFVDVAYDRIETALTNLVLTTDRSQLLGPVALVDAWTIVDARFIGCEHSSAVCPATRTEPRASDCS